MVMWAISFPVAELMMQSWGVIALGAIRQVFAVALLIMVWVLVEGWSSVLKAPWWRGFGVGGIGFGLGAVLLLAGQRMSDPVTPAIAAAMMPIAGAGLEVLFDGRRLRAQLVLGIALAMIGGYLATGVKLAEGSFGMGALLCLLAVVLFAWATRATTHNFHNLSPIGQTTITLAGGMVFMLVVFGVSLLAGFQAAEIGATDTSHIFMLLFISLISLALAQLLWILAAGRLGILLASFHMNAVPFYVMVTVVILLGGEWNAMQAVGAVLVAAGVMIAQFTRQGRS